jgi:hypothetical protein
MSATPFAALNGVPIVGGTLAVPLVGMWTADLRLASDQVQTGAASVTLGNLSLVGTIYRSSPFAGQTRARVIGGAAGWRSQVPAKAYGVTSGVSLKMILTDVATEVGESVSLPADTTVGPFYSRPADLASFTLRTFCPAWYIDTSGVTQIASWPVATVSTPFTVIDQRPDEGYVTIATEDYASWMPGASFTSDTLATTFQSAGSIYTFNEDGTFRFQVLTNDSGDDRILGPLGSLIDQRVASTRFYGRYRYSIASSTSTTVDATPVDSSIGLPSLNGLPLSSDSIASYTPPSSGACEVMFADGLPTYPRVVWTDQAPTAVGIAGGADYVALAGLVKTALSDLASWVESLTYIPGVHPYAGLPTPLTVANPYSPDSVAAQQVKAT